MTRLQQTGVVNVNCPINDGISLGVIQRSLLKHGGQSTWQVGWGCPTIRDGGFGCQSGMWHCHSKITPEI
jgi:hypothetical protein